MCNVYEPATEEYLHAQWSHLKEILRPYKPRIGPRDDGPFVSQNRVAVGQWGMIRPGSPVRVDKTPKGRQYSTNNARIEDITKRRTYSEAWKVGRCCLIPTIRYDEPYWGPFETFNSKSKNTWWRFWRADGQPFALAGLWDERTDPATGEVVPNYTMLTMNCDEHPILKFMHKPELGTDKKTPLPRSKQDKRAVIPIEESDWDRWLFGSIKDAISLIKLPAPALLRHGPADPTVNVTLPV